MCYQNPTKTSNICNAILDRDIHAFCDDYYGSSNVDWEKIGLQSGSVIRLLEEEQRTHLNDCSLTASYIVNTVKRVKLFFYNTDPDKEYTKRCKKPKTGHRADGCIEPPPPKRKPPSPTPVLIPNDCKNNNLEITLNYDFKLIATNLCTGNYSPYPNNAFTCPKCYSFSPGKTIITGNIDCNCNYTPCPSTFTAYWQCIIL